MSKGNLRKINILLIDPHPLFREGLKRIVEMEETFQVVGEGEAVAELIPLYDRHLPDLVLIEINFLQKTGLDALKDLMQRTPDAKVLIFTTATEFPLVALALQSGASGYLLKEMDRQSLVTALKVTLAGGFYLHPKVTGAFVSALQKRSRLEDSKRPYYQAAVRQPNHLFSRREAEVLQLLGEGHSNKSMGERLYISEKTVKNHMSAILRKMNVTDRTQAVVKALKNGWIELK